MYMKKIVIQTIFLLFSVFSLTAQDDHEFAFGKFTVNDFNPPIQKSDTDAGAIIIADIGKVVFEKNEIGDFDVIYKRFERIKIINKNSFAAGKFTLSQDIRTPYHIVLQTVSKPGLIRLRGITYNLENNQIHEDELDQGSVFTEKEGKTQEVEKFTMPGLKEGSVFDLEYTVRSSFQVLDINWKFQKNYPCLWSEYDLTMPDAYQYSIKYRGDTSFFIHTVDITNHISPGFSNTEQILMSHFRWVKLNEPAFMSEPFIRSSKNYTDGVSFEHDWNIFDWEKFSNYSSSNWMGFINMYFFLNRIENFSGEKRNWLNKDLESITKGLQNQTEIAAAIYRNVRDHYSCVYRNSYFTSQSLKETFTEKKGNGADINLLLSAMLRQKKIEADLVILSTTDNGYVNFDYPRPVDYNYLVCAAKINGKEILLDASLPLNSFGDLTPHCYNGGAVVFNNTHVKMIDLLPESLTETNRTDVIVTSDEKGSLSGTMTMHCGTQKSYSIRESTKKSSLKTYFQEFSLDPEVREVKNEEADELGNPDKLLNVQCDLNFKDSAQSDIFYFNPVIAPFFHKNPFSAAKRIHPVEMPFKLDEIYLLTFDIPKGYGIEEMPANESLRMDSNQGSFDYILEKNPDELQLQMRLKLNKTEFTTDEYTALREFFNGIIKKQNEQIVFRKRK